MYRSRQLPVIHALALAMVPLVAFSSFAASSDEKQLDDFKGVTTRPITFWSEGTQLAGDLFVQVGLDEIGEQAEEPFGKIVLAALASLMA